MFNISNVYADKKVTREMAIEYLKLSKIGDITNITRKQREKDFFTYIPNAKPEFKSEIHRLSENTMGWQVTKEQLVDNVINLFTKEEIAAAITFLKSPVGTKMGELNKYYARLSIANSKSFSQMCCHIPHK